MALTRITKGVIKPNENYDTHNINSTGIVTSVGLDVNGNADISGSLSVGGVLTYEDVTSIDSVGIITAQKDIHVGAGLSVVGVGSFGSLDISGDIDVDGHTELDNVNIVGVTTHNGQSKFYGNGGAPLIWGDTGYSGHLSFDGSNNAVVRAASGKALVFQTNHVNTRMTIGSQGNVSINNDLDVDGHTNLDNVSIAGVTTTSTVNFATNARANFASNNRLSIHSNGTNSYLDYAGSLNVRGSSGSAAALSFLSDSNVLVSNSLSINDDLDVDGHTNLDNVSIAGVTTIANNKELVIGEQADNQYNTVIKQIPSGSTGSLSLTTRFPRIYAHDTRIIDIDNGNTHAYFWPNQIGLYANGSEKIQITSGAVNITNANLSVSRDLDVDRHTNLDNVSIAGVTTHSDRVFITQTGTNTTNVVPLEVRHTKGDPTTGITTALFFANSLKRPEFVFRQNHSGNWNNSNNQTQHWRMLWTAPNEAQTTDEVVQLKPGTDITGALTSFGIKVTDNTNGLRHAAYFSSQAQSFYANNSFCLVVDQIGIGITDSIYHYGDTNTKIRFPANDTIRFETAGLHRLNIASNGNISVNYDLDVDGHTNLDNVSVAGVTTFTGDGIFNGGAGAIRIGGASDIRFTSGAWTGESVKLQYHNDKFYWQTGANGWQFRDAAGAATLELSPAGVISGKDLTFSSEIKANNGAGAIRILGGSDIRFNTGNWTGEFSGKLQYHSDKFYWQTGANGWQFRDSSGTATIELSPAGAISGKNLTFAQDVSFSGGGGGCTISANSDIRLGSGNWTGNAYAKIQHHSNQLYIGGGSSSLYSLIFRYNTQDRVYFKSDGTIWPQADSTSDLGTNDKRWANVYADTYYGDGSNLTGVTMTTINNNSNNYVITGTGTANTLQGESALTFSSGRLHSGAITLNDNGVSGALLNIRADDQAPWAFVIGNDTYHASSGLYGYQPNNGDFLLRLVGNSEYKSFTFEQYNGSTNRSWASFGNGGNVKLFYQGGERLATTSTGLTMGGTGAFIPPIGTTAQRPSGSTGMVRYNSTTGQLEVYDGSAWANVNSQPFSGSGGSESLSSRSGYKVHTFTSPGTFTVTGDDTTKTIEVLVIGGGGAGGEGGGGAGALRFSNSFPATPGNYSVTIGGGGSGNQGGGNGGSSSSFGNITAPGGGGGGGSSRGNGQPGGSGGGCRRDNGGSRGNASGSSGGSNNSNSPSSGWGNRGGSGNVGTWCGGGGGGGAGGVGGQGNGGGANSERGGNGGSGLAYSINGSSTGRAGGGGGGCEGSGGPSGPGRGGNASSGGGRGGVSNQVPGNYGATAGSSNTGGGGGGNAATGYSGGNHSGGSGIVIVAYTV